jgi:hypothetical protein
LGWAIELDGTVLSEKLGLGMAIVLTVLERLRQVVVALEGLVKYDTFSVYETD